jgi:NAD(P)-dependent dehydrogenase (short-subunit alcohol dehydrogenase family)
MRPRRLRDLAGLNVFLTGAASGIGRATAEAAAARGARLFLTDVQEGLQLPTGVLAGDACDEPRRHHHDLLATTLNTLRVQPEDHR